MRRLSHDTLRNVSSWTRFGILSERFQINPQVKEPFLANAKTLFSDITIQIISNGTRYLGAPLGSEVS